MTPLPDDPDALLDQLADSFLSRLRGGEPTSPAEYADRHPGLADRILEVFPTLVALEHLGAARASAAVQTDQSAPRAVGGYRIVRVIGRGGMGVVYEAVEESLGRRVALKVLGRAGPGFSTRFRREARIAAGLHHTNIVPVFEVGEADGVPYFAMQFIPGRPLDEVLAEVRCRRGGEPAGGPAAVPDSPAGEYYRAIARLMVQAADAVAYAHAQGVLHRDLKPSNLLVAADGTLWVADFGLATAGHEDALTRSGDLLGTLRYLAPERLAGRCDERSDVYALGATLYEALALRPVYADDDPARLVERVKQGDPDRPSAVDPGVPRDLEIIALTALRRDPDARYPAAAGMADDLRRFLTDRPITARRETAREQARRLCRRYPIPAAVLATALLAMGIGAAAAATAAVWMRDQRDAARAAEGRAGEADRERTRELVRAYLSEARAIRASGRVGQREGVLRAVRDTLAALPAGGLDEAQRAALRDEVTAALALTDVRETGRWPVHTWSHPHDTDLDDALDLVVTTDGSTGGASVGRLSDPRAAVRLAPPPPHAVVSRGLSPDGRWMAECLVFRQLGAVQNRGRVRVWDWRAGRLAVDADVPLRDYSVGFLGDGRRAVVAGLDGVLRLFDLTTGAEVGRSAARFRPNRLAVHPDGRRVAVGGTGGLVEIVTAGSWEAIDAVPVEAVVRDLAWSPDGRWLALGSEDGRVRVWDATGRRFRDPADPHLGPVDDVRFSPDGRLLSSTGWDGVTRLRDWPSGRPLVLLPGRLVRFARDGRSAAVIDDRDLRRYAIDREEVRVLPEPAVAATFSPDGRWLAAAGDGGVRLWSTGGWEATDLGLDRCGPATFHPRTGALTTVGQFSQLRVWPIVRDGAGWRVGPPEVGPMAWPQHDGRHAAWSGDGAILAVADYRSSRVAVYLSGPAAAPRPLSPSSNLIRVAVSPSGEWVAGFAWHPGHVDVWRTADGAHVARLPGLDTVVFSPDSRTLVSGWGSEVRFYRTGDWAVDRAVPRDEENTGPVSAAYSPDGRVVALAMSHRQVRLFDTASGRPLVNLTLPERAMVSGLHFSPDGGRLAVTRWNVDVLVWDLRAVRRALASMDLDWDAPPLPPAPADDGVGAVAVDHGGKPAGAVSWSRLWQLMARGEVLEGRYPDAIHACGEALLGLGAGDARRRAEVLLLRGQYHLANGSPEAARTDWEESVRLAPDWSAPAARLCRLYVLGPDRVRDPARALPLALAETARLPPQAGADGTLGAVYTRLGRYAEARKALGRSLLSSTGTERAADLLFLAVGYHHTGDACGAAAYFQQACEALDAAKGDSPDVQEALSRLKTEVMQLGSPRLRTRPREETLLP